MPHLLLPTPVTGRNLASEKHCRLGCLFQQLTYYLDALISAIGLKTPA